MWMLICAHVKPRKMQYRDYNSSWQMWVWCDKFYLTYEKFFTNVFLHNCVLLWFCVDLTGSCPVICENFKDKIMTICTQLDNVLKPCSWTNHVHCMHDFLQKVQHCAMCERIKKIKIMIIGTCIVQNVYVLVLFNPYICEPQKITFHQWKNFKKL